MVIKIPNSSTTHLTLFDLLGQDEVSLAKGFAYVLGCHKSIYFSFLHLLGIRVRTSDAHFKHLEIIVEKHRAEGRTDIELRVPNTLHIIIECKVHSGRITQQRTQYLNSFDPDAPIKTMCYLTQERGSQLLFNHDVHFKHISWLNIAELLNTPDFVNLQHIKQFLSFAQRHYEVQFMREILIQDLGDATELQRFIDFNVYRRDETFVTPLYFAPYFTRDNPAHQPEGISCLSKVLGILTFNPAQAQNVANELHSFPNSEALINRWQQGIALGNQANRINTYFFLDDPLAFRSPLRKTHRRNSRNWIGSLIPKNRCVSFTEFVRHIPELNQQQAQ